PLDAYGKSLERVGVVPSADLPARLAMGGAPRFKLAGIVVAKKERTSARGNRFAFLQMSDASGFFEVTVFSEVLAQARSLLEAGQPLLVTADARAEEESVRLTAQRIEALDGVVAQAAAGLKVFVSEREAVPPLKGLITRESGGKGRVTVVVPLAPAREVEITLPGGFRISPRVRAAVKSLPGIVEVMDI
ncbi:MAG: OB-fold nucleic acid binding domain-containing protein, partial [Stellaceae bacterium]